MESGRRSDLPPNQMGWDLTLLMMGAGSVKVGSLVMTSGAAAVFGG